MSRAYDIAKEFADYPKQSLNNADKFIQEATTRELQEFIHYINVSGPANAALFERAKISIQMRLTEDAVKTAGKLSQQTDKIIQHTEQLTKQTDIHIHLSEQLSKQTDKLIQHTEQLTRQTDVHIQYSVKLTQQTEKLIAESVSLTALTRQLRFWSIMLGVFAVVQIVIMVFDYLKAK